MSIVKGDKVRFLDEVGEGIVLKVQGDNVLLRSNDGFDRVFQRSQLVLVEKAGEGPLDELGMTEEEKETPFDPEEALKLKESFFRKSLSKPARKNDPLFAEMEVDLHMHELREGIGNLTNSEMLNIQMSHFRLKMEEAIQDGYRKIILIHGVGNGVLKAAVRTALKEEYDFEFYDASMSKYGFGATEVVL